MAFRKVRVFEVREMLRLWLTGKGLRALEMLVGLDRKTVRRYVYAAVALGLDRDGGEGQLTNAPERLPWPCRTRRHTTGRSYDGRRSERSRSAPDT